MQVPQNTTSETEIYLSVHKHLLWLPLCPFHFLWEERRCSVTFMCTCMRTSSKRRLCSFCSSIRFCRSCSSWRLCSSGSLRWAASCACCLFKASERSLFSCCSRRKSLRNVDSPGTFKIELINRETKGRRFERRTAC